MFRIYRTFAGIPTRNEDFLRVTHTMQEAMDLLPLYEDANGFQVAIYEVAANGTDEIMSYQTGRVFATVHDADAANRSSVAAELGAQRLTEIQDLLNGNPWKI